MNNTPVDAKAFRQQKTQMLLKVFLSERGRVFTQDQLIEALFPEDPAKASTKNLQNRISELRKALEPTLKPRQPSSYIQRVGQEGYAFSKEVACALDTETFETHLKSARGLEASEHWPLALEAYEQALTLYQGEYLSEDLYDDWTLPLRNHWHELYLEGLQHAAECQTKLGQYAEAIDLCGQLIQAAPAREKAYAHKMRNHYYLGDTQQALQTYQACIGVLKDEVGLEPSPDTRQLYLQIREGVLSEPTRTASNNLPQTSTRFIGRESEMEQLHDLLSDESCRLLNIVGPGGMGKTRLALQLGSELLGQYPDGVFWVELASISRVDDLVYAIGKAFKFTFAGGKSPEEQLFNYVKEKKMLLILDNFEHLIEGSSLLNELLNKGSQLNLLITSREWLNLQGESVFTLQGLVLSGSTEGSVTRSSAVQLFVESGKRKAPDLNLNKETRPLINRICALVDGMPLGIELAAAWLGAISLTEVAEEIETGLDFLETTMQDVPERHRSMRAIFTATWQRLSESEQQAFMKLSVFRGGFTRDAARQVATVSLPSLRLLLNQSLLHRPRPDRYEIHELLRQFGQEQLTQSDHALEIQSQHLAFYTQLAHTAEPELQGADQTLWLRLLDLEQSNVRAALKWGLAEQNVAAAQLAITLGRYWSFTGDFEDGAKWLTSALSLKDLPDPLRADGLFWQGFMDDRRGAFESCATVLGESLSLYQALGDQHGIAVVYRVMGDLAADTSETEEAKSHYHQSLTLCREVGDPNEILRALLGCARVANLQRENTYARDYLDEALEIARQIKQPIAMTKVLNALGTVAIKQDDLVVARQAFEESEAINQQLNNKPGLCHLYLNFGFVLSRMEELDLSREYQEKSLRLVEELGFGDNYVGLIRNNIGYNEFLQGNYESALAHYELSLTAYEAIKHQHGISMVQNNLGFTSLELGQVDEAKPHLHSSLTLRRENNDEYIGSSLLGLTIVLAHADPASTVKLFAAIDQLVKDDAIILGDFYYEQKFEDHLDRVKTCIPIKEFDIGWKEGQALSLDETLDLALSA